MSELRVRIGIVDHTGATVLETFVFVNPKNVVDWRTDSGFSFAGLDVDLSASGIRPGDIVGGMHSNSSTPSLTQHLPSRLSEQRLSKSSRTKS